MPAHESPVLVVATTPPTADALTWIRSRFAGRKIIALYLADDAEIWPLGNRRTDFKSVLPVADIAEVRPPADGWARWMRTDVEDLDRLRREFLDFVDAWPRQTFRTTRGKSFDESFRRRDGYSLWWTGPGLARHPDHGVFPKLRDIWSTAAAIERSRCGDLVLLADSGEVATIIADRCRGSGVSFHVPPGYASPPTNVWPSQLPYVLAAIARYLVSPFAAAVRAFVCRRRVRRQPESAEDRQRPAVVATALFPREFRRDGDTAHVAFWREVAAEFARRAPDVRIRYLLHTTADRLGDLGLDRLHCHRAWPELRRLDGLAPLPNETVAWRAWLAAARPFVATLYEYCRLERQDDFRNAFRFAGCNVAALYAPLLRKTVAGTHEWDQIVASFDASLRSIGNVRAVLLMGEMYEFAMPVIAAARRLKVTSIGAQHGTIFPMHLIYTAPRGQIDAAPTPDRFAVYGDFAKDTLTTIGEFPADRIVVTGSPRFDHLALPTADRESARRELGLPADRRVILFATQRYAWFKSAVRALFDALASRDDCMVVVKAHPHDRSLDDYRRLAAAAGAERVAFFADRFDELLTACDVLVSGSSTAMLEAILLGRRTICVNFSSEADRYPYAEEGGSLGASSADELRAAVDAALDPRLNKQHEDARRRFLDRHLGPTVDGRAAEVFVQTVLEAIGVAGPAQVPANRSALASERG
jgi:hypothetical protein